MEPAMSTRRQWMLRLAVTGLASAANLPAQAASQAPVASEHGMVVTAQHPATRIGADGLGSAAQQVDADLALSSIKDWRPAVADPGLITHGGLNHGEHRVEVGRAWAANPTLFLRLPSSQTGYLAPIVVPREEPEWPDYGGEIAVVIGTDGRRVEPEKAWQHVFGLSCHNDASARCWQAHSTQWTAGKNFPDTGAFGPFVTTGVDPAAPLTFDTRLNGTALQHAYTGVKIFPVSELIAYLSTFVSLPPGDVIVTGTPGGVRGVELSFVAVAAP